MAPVAKEKTAAQATALRDRLAQLSAELARTAGDLDLPTLRRRVHGNLSRAAHVTTQGWTRLSALDEQARATVARTLASGDTKELLLPRTRARDELLAALESGAELLVVGDSGVGKSALVMDAIAPEQLGDDWQAVAVNLRHLPATPLELIALLGDPVVLLADLSTPQGLLVIDAAEAAVEDHADVLMHLVRSARHAGVRPVLIATTEAAAVVKELLKSGGDDPVEHLVSGLDDEELAAVAEHFPALHRLAGDARGRELLRRPIVVDLLSSAGDPGLPLSESQALDHIGGISSATRNVPSARTRGRV